MVDLVDPDKIEGIVGIERDLKIHYGRAVSSEEMFYILHSWSCRANSRGIRLCQFSIALDDYGIDEAVWRGRFDQPVVLGIVDGRLVPEEKSDHPPRGNISSSPKGR